MITRRVPSLRDALAEVPEFRQAQGRRYELLPVLLLCCVAVMCGCRSQAAIAEWGCNYGERWLALLGIRRSRGPSQPTLHRIFRGLDCEKLEHAVTRWAEQVLSSHRHRTGAVLEGIAMDGKTLCGSQQQGAEGAHLLSTLSHRLGVVLAQVSVSDHTNEISHSEELLQSVVLEGRVITADALLTQREMARSIIDRGGDYLLAVKDNQPTLREDIALVFEHAHTLADTIREARSTDHHGGRITERVLRTSTALSGYTDWPGHEQVLELRRTVTQKRSGKARQEVAYAITSLSSERAGPGQLLKLWREHWHIENKLHWVRDVTFDEDRSQVRAGRIPQVMAALRNAAISLLRVCGAENIAAACRRYAAQPALALTAIGLELRE
ncbi:MAG: ISAs1 family transposase [Pyrinomonadaceae bacterium]|nr:ISAs1 family transposase [Pyrinomonadaceae bacterium]